MSRTTASLALVQTLLVILGFFALAIVLKASGYPDFVGVNWDHLAVFLRRHGMWLDFTFCDHAFTVNNQFGDFWFFVRDPACPDYILTAVVEHCAPLLMPPHIPNKFLAFLALGLCFVTTGTIWRLCLAWFASLLGDRLRGSTTFRDILNRTTGALFVLLGIRLAATR